MYEINQDFREFVKRHADADLLRLRLSCAGKEFSFDLDFALMQIECRRKGKGKLDRFLEHPDFLFADRLSEEQSSDLAVAGFHRDLCAGAARVVDLTAGLGADAMSIAEACRSVTAIELNPLKQRILDHNIRILGLSGIETVCADSMKWLEGMDGVADLMFIDPARRNSSGEKVHAFADCCPDIVGNLDLVMSRCRRLLIKASPLLDVTKGLKELPGVTDVYAVSCRGECKELLFEINKETANGARVRLHAVEIQKDGAISILDETEGESQEKDGEPKGTEAGNKCGTVRMSGPDILERDFGCSPLYLYEPTASLMKLRMWEAVSVRFPETVKADTNTHLFLSPRFYPAFPGRRMRVKKQINGKELKGMKGRKLSVVSRNYPVAAADIRKKQKLAEGDREFLYCFRLGNRPVMLLCEPV